MSKMGAFPPKYEPLSEAHDDDESTTQEILLSSFRRHQNSLRLRIIGLGFCLGILAFTFLILAAFGVILHTIVARTARVTASAIDSPDEVQQGQQYGLRKTGTFTCGPTADDARAKGCKWDVVRIAHMV